MSQGGRQQFIKIITTRPRQAQQVKQKPLEVTLDDSTDEEEEEESSSGEEEEQTVETEEDYPADEFEEKRAGKDADCIKITSTNSVNVGPAVNCLFCYNTVKDYGADKIWKGVKVLRKTSQRLLEYIGKHLSIEIPQDAPRLKDRLPKDSRLLAYNLPLCQRCCKLYYKELYDDFVKYEDAMAKFHSKINSQITTAIALSARQNKRSIDYEGTVIFTGGGGGSSIKAEHDVMREVKRFRAKVVEKNPGGFAEPEPDPLAAVSEELEESSFASTSASAPPPPSQDVATVPQKLNIIKIVKKREFGPDQFENIHEQLPSVSAVGGSQAADLIRFPSNSSVSKSDPSTSKPLGCYAVSNPAPGVIQIIPMKLPNAQGKKKNKRKRREPEYAQQRRNLFTCKFCNQYFPGESKLNHHLVKAHGMEKPLQCEKCEARFIDRANMNSHMFSHLDQAEKDKYKKYQCHLCPVRFRSKKNLDTHIARHAGEKPFSCSICEKKFTSKMSANLCRDKHNGIKKQKCPYCPQRFLRREVLKIHVRTHTGEKPFICKICGKGFAQRSPLRVHLKVHEKLGPNYVPRPPRNYKRKDADAEDSEMNEVNDLIYG